MLVITSPLVTMSNANSTGKLGPETRFMLRVLKDDEFIEQKDKEWTSTYWQHPAFAFHPLPASLERIYDHALATDNVIHRRSTTRGGPQPSSTPEPSKTTTTNLQPEGSWSPRGVILVPIFPLPDLWHLAWTLLYTSSWRHTTSLGKDIG